jgi:hypothetical protein
MSFGKDKFEAMKTSTATVRSCNGGGGGFYITEDACIIRVHKTPIGKNMKEIQGKRENVGGE